MVKLLVSRKKALKMIEESAEKVHISRLYEHVFTQ